MARKTIYCIVEGQTENAVLKRLIAPHLGERDIDLHLPIVRVGRQRGGVKFLKAEELFDQIRRFLNDRRQPHVTTFFDYYAFPTGQSRGWNFVAELKRDAHFRPAEGVVTMIEKEIHTKALTGVDVQNAAARLLPYVQLHELEALFFAEPGKMAAAFGNSALAGQFEQTVVGCGGCERIDDQPQTAPSKRIEAAFPGYIKGRSDFAHGPRIAANLDLAIVRQKCPRFSEWLAKLESL